MYAFWLVLTYDLSEDRCIDDVIIRTFFPYILILYNIKQIGSNLPCVCSVTDHRGRASCATDVLTTFWRPLWSITEQTHGNLEFIC